MLDLVDKGVRYKVRSNSLSPFHLFLGALGSQGEMGNVLVDSFSDESQ
jgi:hypothetical protein